MKIRPMGAELLHADRRAVGCIDGQLTDIHGEVNNRFSQFCERSSNLSLSTPRYNNWCEQKLHSDLEHLNLP